MREGRKPFYELLPLPFRWLQRCTQDCTQGISGKRRSCCWQRRCVGSSAANWVRMSPGINNNSSPGYIGDEVSERCFVFDIGFWLCPVASGVLCFQHRSPGWVLWRGASMAPADSREVSSFSVFLDCLISFSVCCLRRLKCTVLWVSLLLSWDFSQEIAKLILEAKTAERGPLQTQPEYLPSNQLWNLIDAKAFS